MRTLFATGVLVALMAPAAGLAGQASPVPPNQGQPAGTATPPATQQPTPPSERPVGTTGRDPAAADTSVSPAGLGLSVDRIRSGLREARPANRGLLRYDFHVDVYGTGESVDIFKDFHLSPVGPVRYGGMTHSEFLHVVTPEQFRAPGADLGGVAMLALQRLAERR